MSDSQELEKTAMSFVASAVEFEKQGETDKAISSYEKAIERLSKLIERYPNHSFKKIYQERADLYQERILALQTENIKIEEPEENKLIQEKPELKQESTRQPPSSPDLVPILLEINRKLEELTAYVNQLKDDVVNLKVNVNDASAKTELSQKEINEIKNLLYSIKYER